MINEDKQSSTIRSYISAIKSVLKDDGIELNQDQYLLASLTKACELRNDCVKIQLPIRKGMLKILLNNVKERYPNQVYLVRLYRALFSTAYFGLFRIGEITAGTHPVLARDVLIADNKDKMMFMLRSSKTHGPGSKPQTIKINSSRSPLLDKYSDEDRYCPYTILRDYMQVRRKGFITINEPFFVFRDRTPVTPNQMRQALKEILLYSGFSPLHYGSHGFRSGRARDLLDLGVSVESLKFFGRWKSNSVYTYLKF